MFNFRINSCINRMALSKSTCLRQGKKKKKKAYFNIKFSLRKQQRRPVRVPSLFM